MIFFQLFLTFFEIGLFTFGGGYAMISIVFEKVLEHGWLTEAELLNMIAVAESTPGPIAVNMATFVGSVQGSAECGLLGPFLGGILGSACATLGVVLPSFIIILLISAILKNFLEYVGVQAFLSGVRPCVVALILGTSINLLLSEGPFFIILRSSGEKKTILIIPNNSLALRIGILLMAIPFGLFFFK